MFKSTYRKIKIINIVIKKIKIIIKKFPVIKRIIKKKLRKKIKTLINIERSRR